MRVNCPHCSSKAFITSTKPLENTDMALFCACSNVQDCGASFVYKLQFSHNIKPPLNPPLELLKQAINTLSPEQQAELKRMLDDG